jgi:hypothetical protein
MAATEYSKANADFSDLAHLSARDLIYPLFFKTSLIKYESTLLSISEDYKQRDVEQSIDRICFVQVKNDWFKQPLKFTIQERFRRIRFADFKDVTITAWNNSSDLPSELYKIEADYFVYGYYNDINKNFTDAVVIDVAELKRKICSNELVFNIGVNTKKQDFIGIKFNELDKHGLIVWRM